MLNPRKPQTFIPSKYTPYTVASVSPTQYRTGPLNSLLKLCCVYTVLLEYFAGKKPLRMSQISTKIDPLRSGKDCVSYRCRSDMGSCSEYPDVPLAIDFPQCLPKLGAYIPIAYLPFTKS